MNDGTVRTGANIPSGSGLAEVGCWLVKWVFVYLSLAPVMGVPPP